MLKINVTAEDIAKGVEGHRCLCPIALAVARDGNWYNVAVGNVSMVTERLLENGGCESRRYSLPGNAQRFIADFDRYGAGHVSPFAFTAEEVYLWRSRQAASR